MPSKEDMDLEKDIIRQLSEQVKKNIPSEFPPELWKPDSYELDKIRSDQEKKFREQMMQDWREIQQKNPDEEFRRKTTKDISEIKDAIRKLGILFSEDAPSKEMQAKYKMLKDAYKKYKMVEALILGQDK